MADHTLKYPNTTAPTSTLTFTRAWLLGEEPYHQFNGENGETKGGAFQSVSRGTNVQYQSLTVQVPRYSAPGGGHVTDWPDVVTFIRTTVNFGVRACYWTDDSSVVHEVRILNTTTEPKAAYPNYLEYTFLLRLES